MKLGEDQRSSIRSPYPILDDRGFISHYLGCRLPGLRSLSSRSIALQHRSNTSRVMIEAAIVYDYRTMPPPPPEAAQSPLTTHPPPSPAPSILHWVQGVEEEPRGSDKASKPSLCLAINLMRPKLQGSHLWTPPTGIKHLLLSAFRNSPCTSGHMS